VAYTGEQFKTGKFYPAVTLWHLNDKIEIVE
jgi:hypothetical protein